MSARPLERISTLQQDNGFLSNVTLDQLSLPYGTPKLFEKNYITLKPLECFSIFEITTNKFHKHIFPLITQWNKRVTFAPQQDRKILYAIGQLVSSNQLLYLTTNQKPHADTSTLYKETWFVVTALALLLSSCKKTSSPFELLWKSYAQLTKDPIVWFRNRYCT